MIGRALGRAHPSMNGVLRQQHKISLVVKHDVLKVYLLVLCGYDARVGGRARKEC